MNDIALATPVEGGVTDTSITPNLPAGRADYVPAALDDPAMHAHEEHQQEVVDKAIHSLTGKGNLIDRIV